jgi:arylsulfatase A-like enzyme
MGLSPADLLTPWPRPPELDRRADALRRALAGCNVLFVVLDAASARRFSAYGHSQKTTPEIDRIAAEGVLFERAYTTAVFTRAAMASTWTSRYPDEGMTREDLRLPAERLTLAELLAANGIRTAAWVANPNAGAAAGLERGFMEFAGVYSQPGRPGGAVRAEAVAERFSAWLANSRRGRFFAYLHFREPHFPYDPPPPFDTLFGPDGPLPRHARDDKSWTIRVSQGRAQASVEELAHLRRLYDGNLAYVDAQLGALRRGLEQAGIWERTLVIVSADHGEELLEHGFIGHNEQVYQETTWIPLVVRFPKGSGPAGMRVPALVDLLDVAPTIADVFGVLGRAGAAPAFQGRSLLPVVLGAPGKPATVSRSIMKRPSYALTDGRFKLVHDIRRGAQELFDLRHDPNEQEDLSVRDPLRLAAFREALYRFILDRAGGGSTSAAPLTPEEIEQLRALGYIN